MSIVKMKKLKLVALSGDRDTLLKELQKQGCLEIREFDDPPEGLVSLIDKTGEQAHLKELNEAKKKAEAALKILKKYAYVKSGMFSNRQEISESEFFSESAGGGKYAPVREVISAEAKLSALYGEEYALTSFISSLSLWKDINIPLQIRQTESSYVVIGAIPATKNIDDFSKALEGSAEEVFLSPAGSDRDQKGLVLICSKKNYDQIETVLRDFNFNRAPVGERKGTAAENIAEAEKSLIEVKADIDLALSKLAQLGANRTAIKLYIDRLEQEIAQETAQGKLLASQKVFALQGWVSQPDVKALEGLLGKYACAYELDDPVKGEKVPVRLHNNMITRPLTMVTEMYSLPAYEGIDPNPLIMPFYTIFFGMMFNDLGYGLVLIALSLFIQLKAKPRGTIKYMMGLMLLCGITTSIMGVITGSFFGDSISVVAGMYGKTVNIPVILNPLGDPVMVLAIAIGLGVVHILFGMGVKAYMLIRDGQPWDALFDVGSWWLLFAGIAVMALGGTYWVVIAGVAALVLTQGRSKPTIVGKLVGGLASLYNITSYFGDILSYSRIMALMLAGGIIASIVNVLGSLAGSIFVFIIVFIIGHTFNMGINIIGTYVHAARLQYLEFFGKFYVDGGKPFRPLAIKTKYYDIIKEDK